jgi:hypothetical protein
MEPWKITPPFESPTPLVWPVLPGLTAGLELAGAFEAGVPELEQAPRPKTTIRPAAAAVRPRLLRQRLTASGSAVKRFMDVVTPLAKSERWYSGTFRGGPCWYAEPASRLAAFAADFRQP